MCVSVSIPPKHSTSVVIPAYLALTWIHYLKKEPAFTTSKRKSRCTQPEVATDLDFADDMASIAHITR